MCVICISEKGTKQPTRNNLRSMWLRNPDGAGYMFSREGSVEIHKGFMNFEDFYNAVRSENFTANDAVVYHFRISTQAGVNPAMTHPFPLSNKLQHMTALDLLCEVGICHNGIISLTSDPKEKRYSDTALFITKYASQIIKRPTDLEDSKRMNYIAGLIGASKLAFLNQDGKVYTIGAFHTDSNGLRYSNMYHLGYRYLSDLDLPF